MNKTVSGLIVLTIAASLIGSKPSTAAGALAIGLTGDIPKDGIAMGLLVNELTKEAASTGALELCHKWSAKGATKAAVLCRIVETFTRQCAAFAFDPKPGTPGAGWAIAPDNTTAEAQALTACQATAGADRRKFCVVDTSSGSCDTHD